MRGPNAVAGVAGALAAVLVGVHIAAETALVRETAWLLLVVGACAAVVLGVRRHRPRAVRPWRLLALGLGLLVLGNLLNHPLWGSPSWTGAVSQVVELVAFPLFGLAAFDMVRWQAPQGDREGAIDAAIVMVALSAVLSGTVFTAEVFEVTDALGHAVLVIAPLLLAAVCAAGARLLFVGARVFSSYVLAGAALAGLLGHVVRTTAQSAGAYQRGGWDDVLIGLAYAGTGMAALHPTMRRLTALRQPDERRLTLTRMGVLGLCLLAPPVTALVSREPRPSALLGSVVVSLLVLWRLWRLVMEREAVRDEMRRRSVHDALTGLPNRVQLLERLGAALRADPGIGGRTAVLFIDLDGFKQVNDDFGHRVGDETLLAVVERLRGVVRDQDLLGRLAGDEFVVLCEDVEEADVASVAHRLLAAFDRPFALTTADVTLGVSIGVAVGGSGATPEQLLHEADAAMYSGKERGGGRVEFFGEELGTRLQRRRRLEADLAAACEGGGGLRLVYQPIRAIAPGAEPHAVGVEVLLRWDHPVLGRVAPGELIPVADASGLIVDLGAWVLREACAQLAAWRRAGDLPEGFRLFVNLSSRQLLHARLPEQVAAVLAATGVAPQDLVLEVTETAVLDDDGLAVRVCRALRGLGLAIALDDFGTGYSSLTHLKRLPPDLIKIDATFVRDLGDSADDRAIVSAIVAIAGQLGARVVGEGVETAAQLEVLRRLGCDFAQGHRLGAPQDAADLDLRAVVRAPR